MSKEEKTKVTKYGDSKIVDGGTNIVKRILVCTPCGTGSVRMEWVLARYGQIIPMNWSMVQYTQFMNANMWYRYALPDAQNLIAQEAVKGEYEWLLLIEDDNVLPPDAFVKLNEYMHKKDVPIVSGLYFSRSIPSEPLIFRGRGTSVYWDWKFGDKVWCDGVPTGTLLINVSILKAMYDESPEYTVPYSNVSARRIFEIPQKMWTDGGGNFVTLTGTTDLQWCTRIIEGDFFTKAGWPKYAKKKYPFLVDTQIFVKHIDRNTGEQFPPEGSLT